VGIQQPGILQPAEADSPSIGHRRFSEDGLLLSVARPYRSMRGGVIIAQKNFHCTVVHGPKLALRGVTSHLVTDMCMYSHAIVGVSPHDYGRAMVGYICPTHTVSVTYKLGVTAA
jgi:hypothetical protein